MRCGAVSHFRSLDLAPPIPQDEPTAIVAGDSVQFTKSFGTFSALDGWVLKYRLVGPLGIVGSTVDKTVTATQQAAGSGGWLVAFLPADTAGAKANGSYRLVGQVSLASEIHTVYDGVVRVTANPLTATVVDLLTHAERTLTIIEAKIEGRLTADLEHYQIDGKAVGKIKWTELVAMRAKYKQEIWRLRHPGVSAPRRVVRFGGA